MNFTLSTQVETINFKKILRNMRKPRRWADKIVIFDSYGITLTLLAESIDVQDNKVRMKIRYTIPLMNHQEEIVNHESSYNTFTMSMDRSHYNKEVMINQVLGTIERSIDEAYENFAMDTPEYRAAALLDKQEVEAAEDRAIEELDAQEIEDEDIRKAYIKDKRSKAWMAANNTRGITRNFKTEERERIYGIIANTVDFK